jgi:hypothetical protein
VQHALTLRLLAIGRSVLPLYQGSRVHNGQRPTVQFCRLALSHMPEDGTLHGHRCEDLASTIAGRYHRRENVGLCRMFQKGLYNFESLYKFIQRTRTVFLTVIMYQDTPSFTWDSSGSKRLPLVIQGVSKGALQRYSKCYCAASVTKTFTLKVVQTVRRSTP